MAMGLSACFSSTAEVSSSASLQQRAAAVPMETVFTKTYLRSVSTQRIKYSGDGKYFLVAEERARVSVFSSADFDLVHTFELGARTSILGVDFIGNDHLYIGLYDGEFRFKAYATPQWNEVASHQFEESSVSPIAANQNFAVYNETLVNWHTGQTYHANRQHPQSRDPVFLTQDNYVISPESYGWILVENPVTGDSSAWNAGEGRFVSFAMDTPDNKYLVTYSINGLCKVWQRRSEPKATGNCGTATRQWQTQTMATLPDKYRFAVSWGSDVRVYQIDPATGQLSLNLEVSVSSPVVVTAISQNNKLAFGTEDGHIEVWDLPTLGLVATYRPDAQMLRTITQRGSRWGIDLLEFAPDGKILLAAITHNLLALKVPD